jgi:hypothetical protein
LLRRLTIVLCLFAVIAAGAGCGSDSKEVTGTNDQGQVTTQTVPNIRFAKAKFIIHGALAYGAFHRYIYKPYKAGTFRQGADGRTAALVKGTAAGLFIATQLRAMRQDALSDDTLRPIANKIGLLVPAIAGLSAAMKGGNPDPTGVTDASSSFDGIIDAAKGVGIDIPLNRTPSIP